MMILKCI